MTNPRRFALPILAILFAGLLAADRVDDIVQAQMAAQHIPGVSLAVMKDGHIIRYAGYGLANVELHAPVVPASVFKIGSISKQFLASAAMILVQDGQLRLEDPVQKYLEDAPESWRGITLRHLLSHTSGLTREGPAFDPLKAQPDIDVIRSAYPLPLVFPTGQGWQYCNLGYFTIAEIIHRVSGMPWPDFLAKRVFQPLGMTATRTTTWRDIVPNRAAGYDWDHGVLYREKDYFALRPSGAFLSTVEDLAKWDAALYTESPLRKETRERMWTPVAKTSSKPSAPSYGLGWEIEERAGKRVVQHGGSLTGFKAYFARFPDEGLSFVVLTNLSSARPNDILWKVAAVWLSGVDRAEAP